MKNYVFLLFVAASFFASSTAAAQALVYRPINPSFGGDTFNYNWLLSSAQVQDRTVDPAAEKAAAAAAATTSDLTDFSSDLNRQLLSTLSRQIYENQFGEEGIKVGSYQYGNFSVDVSPGNEGLIVRITDGKGGETSITVPYY